MLAKKSTFSEKNFENWTNFTRIWVISKNYWKICIFLEGSYKSREIPGEFYYLVETFIKKAQKWLRWRTIGNGMKILETGTLPCNTWPPVLKRFKEGLQSLFIGLMKFPTKNGFGDWTSPLSSSGGTERTSLLLLKYVNFTQIWNIYLASNPGRVCVDMISASKKSEVEVNCSKTAYQTCCLQRGTASLRSSRRFPIWTG